MPVFAQTCLVAFLLLPVSSPGVSAGLSTQPEIQADKGSLCLETQKGGVGTEVAALHGAGEVARGAECPQGGSRAAAITGMPLGIPQPLALLTLEAQL